MLAKQNSLLFLLVALLLMILSILLGSNYQASASEIEINGDNLEVGDVIFVGTFDAEGNCVIDTFKIQTTALGDSENKSWLGIMLDATMCQVIVNAKWIGNIENGPSDVIVPLLGSLSINQINPLLSPLLEDDDEAPIITEEGETSGGSGGGHPCKTSEQLVFMYGYGGQNDKLTRKTGKITFCYDGTNATIISQSGTCQGANLGLGWKWKVDACVRTQYIPGPSSIVVRTGRGDYHCDPINVFPCNISNPDGYYHSLYDSEDGHGNGLSHCSFWYTGVIVSGVNRQILQGCN